MAIPTQSLSGIIARAVANFRTSFPGFPLGPKKFLGRMARAVGMQVWAFQLAVEDLDKDIVPTANSSSEALADAANLYGLPDGSGNGTFGPLVPTTASGGGASPTGVGGTVFAQGLIAVGDDGTTQIAVASAATIPGGPGVTGSIAVGFVAVTPGSVGNLPAGTICTWQSTPPGADPSFVLTSPLTNGTDAEDRPSIATRIAQRLQNPPRGGVSEDYTEWSEEVAGIVGVFIYGRRSGTGIVDVIPLVGGQGVSRVPTTAQIALVQASIDSQRPVGADQVQVLQAFTAATGHLLIIKVKPNGVLNAFDWDDRTGGPFTVDLYTPGATPTLRLNTLAPTSLKTAISNWIAGNSSLKPRLQVLSTGRVVNLPVACINFADGGGKTTLTLDALPNGWTAPTGGDTVYAYGPVVSQIATAAADLVDSLGPSRQSGYGDTFLPWQDTITISSIIGIAEQALDATGNQLVTEVPVGGVTIDGVAADVQAADATVNPPELLYLSHAAVIAA